MNLCKMKTISYLIYVLKRKINIAINVLILYRVKNYTPTIS